MKKNKKIKALTIIETLLTLVAISIMLAGPLAFVSKSFSYAKFVQQNTIATGLSQEGLELITAYRNGVASSTVISQLDSCASSNGCYIDWSGVTGGNSDFRISPCTGDSCRLYKSQAGDFFTYKNGISSADGTDFLRQIIVKKEGINKAYTIKSRVWSDLDSIPVDVVLQKTIFIY
jgi:Tfp pilus assembly protein PilV